MTAEERFFKEFYYWMEVILPPEIVESIKKDEGKAADSTLPMILSYKQCGFSGDLMKLYGIMLKLGVESDNEALANEGVKIIHKLKELYPIVDVMSK